MTKYNTDVSKLFLCMYFDVLLIIFNTFFSANVSYIPIPNKVKQEHIAYYAFSFAWLRMGK